MIRTYKRQRIADYCGFCKEGITPDYKDVVHLRRYLTERYLVLPRRYSGVCAKHQRKLTQAVKNARQMALIPYTDVHAL